MDYKKYLTDEILAHYLALQTDNECGGILNFYDPYCNLINDEKDVWFQGRAMWSYSMTYMLIEKRQEYLDMCDHIFNFIKKLELVDGGKLPYWVSRDGKTMTKSQGDNYYSDCFCAMGCAQYYRVSGREDVKEYAEKFFDIMYDGYFKVAKSGRVNSYGVRTWVFGLHMAMLAGAQFVRNAGIRVEKADYLAKVCVERMMTEPHVDNERKMVIEELAVPGEVMPMDKNHTCPGHVYEAAWFVMCEGEYRNDQNIKDFGRKLLDYAMPEGFEEKEQLIPTFLRPDDPWNFECTDNTISWPAQEAIIAYRVAYHMFGEEKYKRLSEIVEKAAMDYFADREHGRWYINIKRGLPPVKDRTDKSGHLEGPFHLERMLIGLAILAEDGSIKRYIS